MTEIFTEDFSLHFFIDLLLIHLNFSMPCGEMKSSDLKKNVQTQNTV